MTEREVPFPALWLLPRAWKITRPLRSWQAHAVEESGDVTAHFHSGVYLASDGTRFVPGPWPDDVLTTAQIHAQVFIGTDPDPSTPADSFDVIVYSPSSFARLGYRPELQIGEEVDLGAGYCFMQSWDQAVFEEVVRRICTEASPGPNWESVALRIGQKIPWEYYYRYDIEATPRPDWQSDFTVE